MKKINGLAKASHFGPNMLVTALSLFFASLYWWEGPALVIAFGVFLGQLTVGWSNDLIDYQDDLKHQRMKKQLVAGTITSSELTNCLRVVLPLAILVNLFGPLGFIGGGLSIFALGWAALYNFYFKFTIFSWLPYAVAFAALPSCMALSKGHLPPLWMWVGGALCGIAVHFLNVIKDMKEDQVSGIKGLPQRCGRKVSIVIAAILILAALALLVSSDLSLPPVTP